MSQQEDAVLNKKVADAFPAYDSLKKLVGAIKGSTFTDVESLVSHFTLLPTHCI